jgi:iron(III) transport system permease protein
LLARGSLFFFVLLVLSPLVAVLIYCFNLESLEPELYSYLTETLLWKASLDTFKLLSATIILTATLGILNAWWVSFYDYPARRLLQYLLLLPLALPSYVLAFSLLGLTEYSGPIQSYLRQEWNIVLGAHWNLRNSLGAILALSFSFFPYVYLLTQEAFRTQGLRLSECARVLGAGPAYTFFYVLLPAARPWILASLGLVAMETLSDFGTVSLFPIETFTTALYKSWFSLFSIKMASVIASLLIVLSLSFLLMKSFVERKKLYTAFRNQEIKSQRKRLSPLKGWTVFGLQFLLLSLIWFMPLSYLLYQADYSLLLEYSYWTLIQNSFVSAFLVATISLLLLFVVLQQIRSKSRWSRFFISCAKLGYSTAGTVLALGFYLVFLWIDNLFFNERYLQGSYWPLFLALWVRFFILALEPVESAIKRIPKNLEDSARSLGMKKWQYFRNVYFPFVGPAFFVGFYLIFVDVVKEIPISLMLRPYGWETLSTQIYQFTSEGEWQKATLSSLILVFIASFGFIGLYLSRKFKVGL